MFEKNPALKVGQTVIARTPVGDIMGVVESIAPESSRDGRKFVFHEFGFTMDSEGSEFWALQEDAEIIREVQ